MKKLLPLVLALVIFAGLVPAIETPACAIGNGPVIKVKMSGLYDIIVNPYRMVMETMGGPTSESIVSEPCLITNETKAPLVINATPAVTTIKGGVIVALQPINNDANKDAKSVFLFLELKKLNSPNVYDVADGSSWMTSSELPVDTSTYPSNCVRILDSTRDTATLTIPAASTTPSYAAFKISGDCGFPDQKKPWVTVAQNVGDVLDGFTVTVTFSFAVSATFTVRYHFYEPDENAILAAIPSWTPVNGEWTDVGVFANDDKVNADQEYSYDVGKDLTINIKSDVYDSNSLPPDYKDTIKVITDISYSLYDSATDTTTDGYIYSVNADNIDGVKDENTYVSYTVEIKGGIDDQIDIYVYVQDAAGHGSSGDDDSEYIPWT